ncbi:MAG: shikimate dehydrogenase, partial [Acidipropionibacterium jensenii]|nr:shikimate dehydrogenase [Acidipropionibacterium jensenii]
AQAGRARGCEVIDGLDLLAGQAVGQVALMTGRQVPMEVLWAAAHQENLSRHRS